MTENHEFYPYQKMTPEQKRVASIHASLEKLKQAIGTTPEEPKEPNVNANNWFMPKTYMAPQVDAGQPIRLEKTPENGTIDIEEIARIIEDQAQSTDETKSIFGSNL